VAAARENVARNGLAGRIAVSGGDIAALSGNFQLVVANIVHDVLLALSGHLHRLTASQGALVLSGILAGEQEESIGKHFAALGFSLRGQRRQGEWAALRLDKIR
jgi:ribosomal protein L11 methyltransferase